MSRDLETVRIDDHRAPGGHFLEIRLTAYSGPGGSPYMQLMVSGPEGNLHAGQKRQTVRWILQQLLDAIDDDSRANP